MMSVRIRVPASSANLGPGFDTLAIALSLYTTVDVTRCDPDEESSVETGDLLGGENLVMAGAELAAWRIGRSLPPHRIRVTSDIPVARGLGSSAAALIAGLLAGNWLLDEPLDDADLFDIAADFEGHADNVAAAQFGGSVIGFKAESNPFSFRTIPIVGQLDATLFIPDAIALTRDARKVVPDSISRDDAVFTSTGVGLIVYALATGDFSMLRRGMDDRLHQPYRAALFPHLIPMISESCAAGAWGAALSGAGPSVIALHSPEMGKDIETALSQVAAGAGIAGKVLHLDIERSGASIESIQENSAGTVVTGVHRD